VAGANAANVSLAGVALCPGHAAGDGFAGITDEASAIERQGLQPRLVEGTAQNFKVTYPADFALAEAVLAARAQTPPHKEST
jgi:2-C-methyl-D-erythritol 4-phosphate cytidylyltransferase